MKKAILYLSMIVLDLLLYLFLSFNLINYEDSYDGTKGGFYSLNSMNSSEKIFFILLIILYAINIIVASFVIFKIIKRSTIIKNIIMSARQNK